MTMIDYSLAKELKEAGFPQAPKGYTERPNMGVNEDGKVRDFEPYDAFVPTLEELIEGCGERFAAIRNVAHAKFHYSWVAKIGRAHV